MAADQRIVVKIGSQVLCDTDGNLNLTVMSNLVSQLAGLSKAGWQVLLVSSGAVAAGRGYSGDHLQRVSDPVARKQVMAATGQVRLMETYRNLFDQQRLPVAQVLATKSDFQTRRHYLNMRGCIEALLVAGIIPIVNENDVVAVTELMFTDNDELAGLLAGMVDAKLLCLLSSVPGVFDGDPDVVETRLIANWDDELHKIDQIVTSGTSGLGRGGMGNKLAVARKVARLGTEVVIADGTDDSIISKILGQEPAGTRFPVGRGTSPAKRWLASADAHASGSVTINAGAEEVLLDASRLASLLPVGVVSVKGTFDQGDVIQILSENGKLLGCGQASCNHLDAEKQVGLHDQKPLVHYDFLYLVE